MESLTYKHTFFSDVQKMKIQCESYSREAKILKKNMGKYFNSMEKTEMANVLKQARQGSDNNKYDMLNSYRKKTFRNCFTPTVK